jgi:type IV pilus assembly protein PilP
MKNYLALIRTLICLMGTALLLSCETSHPIADQPQVVRKKIAAPADRSQPALAVAAAPSKPQAPAADPQPPAAQVKPPDPPGTAPVPAQPPKPAEEPSPPTKTAAVSTAGGETPPAQPAAVLPAVLTVDPVTKGTSPMAAPDAPVAAILNIQATEPYNPKGKMDPFEPLFREESVAKSALLKPKKRASETPLENIDIGQLKLVAIINARGGNYAMVEESSGKGYVIKRGTYIGRNSGKVLSIEPDKILIEEEYEDLNGKTVTQNKEMTLPKPPGEL